MRRGSPLPSIPPATPQPRERMDFLLLQRERPSLECGTGSSLHRVKIFWRRRSVPGMIKPTMRLQANPTSEYHRHVFRNQRLKPVVAYGTAIVVVGAAYLLTEFFRVWLNETRLFFMSAAVMIAALYGGLGPGLLASALATLASAFFFMPPTRSLYISFDDIVHLLAFVVVAILLSWLGGTRRRATQALQEANDRLESRVWERTAALTAANEELQEEIAERKKAEAQILAYQLRLQSLAAEVSMTEEQERRRIATVLHDAVGHRLAVAVMKLHGLLDGKSN